MKTIRTKYYLLAIMLAIYATCSSAQYLGGSGKGDANAQLTTVGLAVWQSTPNNRVLTQLSLLDASGNNYLAITNASTLTSTTRIISANTLSSTAVVVTPSQPGIHAMYVQKQQNQPNQLLIKGDFRSIYINPTTGQIQCNSAAGNYIQLLWLGTDIIEVNTTQVFIDKKLTTLYANGDGSSWYNIKDGKAIRINASGLIVDLCN
jgi:hypothetical protein